MKIEYDEKQNIEFKEIWRDEYLKWICGFANAQGGTLYIGVNDNAEVVGIEKICKALSLQNLNPPEYTQLGEAVCTTFHFVEPTTSESDIPAGSVEQRVNSPKTAQ